jgi:hypothetical protein
LLAVEPFCGDIWEPAAGDGSISKVLEETFTTVSTELRQGDGVYGRGGVDFLKCGYLPNQNIKTIFTNPPFFLAQEFISHAKTFPVVTIAMLLKLSFLEGQKRKIMFDDKKFPLKKVYVFSKRLSFTPGKNNGLIAYAWFIWDRSFNGKPTIGWL